MSSQPERSNKSNPYTRQSVDAQREVLMDILRDHISDEDVEGDKENRKSNGGRSFHTTSKRDRNTNHIRIASQTSTIDIPPTPPPKSERQSRINENSTPSKRHNYSSNQYTRPTGPELVSINKPSCVGLPLSWNNTHDRFIAYLATHAPLDHKGRIPNEEEERERWGIVDIVRLVGERWPWLCDIKPSVIEKRLVLLDQAGDNDYFKKKYGAYMAEEWGKNI